MKNGLLILAFVGIAIGANAQSYAAQSKAVPELQHIEFPQYLREPQKVKELKLPPLNQKPMDIHRKRYNDDVYWQPNDPKPNVEKPRYWFNNPK
jgi:hypothetical protein